MKMKRDSYDPRLERLDLSEQERIAMTRFATILEAPAGTTVCRQGRPRAQMVWLLEGHATVTRNGEHVADLGPGDVAGEISMLTAKPFYSADVVTTEESLLVVMSVAEWQQVESFAPSLSEKLRQIAAVRLTTQV